MQPYLQDKNSQICGGRRRYFVNLSTLTGCARCAGVAKGLKPVKVDSGCVARGWNRRRLPPLRSVTGTPVPGFAVRSSPSGTGLRPALQAALADAGARPAPREPSPCSSMRRRASEGVHTTRCGEHAPRCSCARRRPTRRPRGRTVHGLAAYAASPAVTRGPALWCATFYPWASKTGGPPTAARFGATRSARPNCRGFTHAKLGARGVES